MADTTVDRLAEPLAELVLEDFTPRFDQLGGQFKSDPRWAPFRKAGTELWLDTGDIEAVGRLWSSEFSAVTTNNTLLNKEVQKGQYDALVRRAAAIVRGRSGRRVDDRHSHNRDSGGRYNQLYPDQRGFHYRRPDIPGKRPV